MSSDDVLALGGRMMMALIFLASAFSKIANFEATAHFMDSHGMVQSSFFCAGAAALEAFGGLALLLGYYTETAAGVLFLFLIVTTAIFHHAPDQRIELLKNVAIMGGLLQMMAWGPGAASCDGRRR